MKFQIRSLAVCCTPMILPPGLPIPRTCNLEDLQPGAAIARVILEEHEKEIAARLSPDDRPGLVHNTSEVRPGREVGQKRSDRETLRWPMPHKVPLQQSFFL